MPLSIRAQKRARLKRIDNSEPATKGDLARMLTRIEQLVEQLRREIKFHGDNTHAA